MTGKKIIALLASLSIFMTSNAVLADKVNVAYSEYSSSITELNGYVSDINNLITQCKSRGISTDYETMRVNILKRFTGYLRSELLNGIAYRTTENGYTETDVKNIYDYNVSCLKETAKRTISDLNKYLSGEKKSFSVPEILTSKTETNGRTLYAETRLDGVTGRNKVFLNGVGHYSAYNDMDFLKLTGSDILQMEIGISTHCKPANGIKDWISGWYLKPECTAEVTEEEAHSGRSSVKFTNSTPQTANYYYNLTQAVKVEPNTKYTYSFWAKGKNINSFVYKTLSQGTFKWLAMNENRTVEDWTQYSVTYTTGADQTEDRVYLSTEGTTEAIYIDDVQLIKTGDTKNLLANGGFEEKEESGKIIDSDPSKLWRYEEIFREAEEKNMKISLLLSPQYFVSDLYDIYPDLKDNGDGIGYVLLHPAAVQAVKYHIKTILETAKKYKSINDICLANEPRNETKYGGNDSYYKPYWTKYLTEKYGTVQKLNSAWGTSYPKIEDADFPKGINGYNTQCYDYIGFNNSVMTEWIKLMSETAKETAPELPVHIKTMPYVSRADESDKRWLVGAGVNPEEISEYVDINGNDSDLRFLSGSTSTYSDFIEPKRMQQSFWYEYLSSVKEAPVFNSEDHILANGNKDYGSAHRKLIGMSQWMGAVHGRNMDCMWIWDRSSNRSETYESIMYRPDVYEKMSEVNLDLKRLSNEVYAVMEEGSNVGILYSDTSRIYSRAYINAVYSVFEACLFNGVKPGFITESSLDKADNYKLIIIPYAAHVTKETLNMLKAYIQNGGKTVILGESPEYDENGAPHDSEDVSYIKENSSVISASASGNYTSFDKDLLVNTIGWNVRNLKLSDVELIDCSTGKSVSDVEYIAADYNNEKLISICNYDWDSDKEVSLYINGEKVEIAKELRSGENISGNFTIKSFEPILLAAPVNYSASIKNVYTSEDSIYFDITSKTAIENAAAISAVYRSDGALESVKATPVQFVGKDETAEFAVVSDTGLSGKSVKVMLWDNLDTMTPLTETAKPDGNVIYREKFLTENSISKFKTAGSDYLPGQPQIAYNSESECAVFEAWGQNTGIFPGDDVNAKDFVMECDISYSKTAGYRNRPIWFGLIFGFADSKHFTSISYNPETGTVIMGNAMGEKWKTRYAEKGRGTSVMLDEGENAHIKLAVQNGFAEFFVNDELCYTFNSSDHEDIANDFKAGGKLGFYNNADKTLLTIDNINIRKPDDSDKAYYSNAYMTPGENSGFSPISELTEAISTSTVTNSTWGNAIYAGSGWDNTASYINIPVNGNYSVDMDFALKEPLNDSRYIGIAFGINKPDSKMTYNVAGVKENGDMFIEQKCISDGKEDRIANAEYAVASCADTISEEKKNDDGKTNYLLSYIPPEFKYVSERDSNNRRHNLHLEIKDGTAVMTFEGKRISCKLDKNGTGGFAGIRAAGTGAYIYSMRVAPL